MTMQMKRRGFLKAAGVAGATLAVGFNAKGLLAAAPQGAAGAIRFNPFVTIDGDGTVTVVVKHFEMGQGTTTGLATLVAEELDVPWESIKVVFAPANGELYKNLAFGLQATGGSTAIANSFQQYRTAGAAARDMLVRAAAAAWNVPAEQVALDNGMLKAGARTAGIGELVAAAAKLAPAKAPKLKDPSQFTLIGTDKLPRKDSHDKTNGAAVFAMDVKVPNMLYAVVLRPPRFGGKLKTFDAAAASAVQGFAGAQALPNKAGVAVYAKSTWAAIQSRRAIKAQWDETGADLRGTPQSLSEYQAKLDAEPAFDASHKGNIAQVAAHVEGAAKSVEAQFMFPLLAHAPMEPLNCVIEPTGKGVRIHDGSQFQGITQPAVAAILNIAPENVEIVTYYAGGSFGRRATPNTDYHTEAALAFAALGGQQAVKLVWTREDDLAGGFYRPMVAHRAKVAIGDDGKISGWSHRTVAQSIAKGTPFESMLVKNGADHSSVEGIADTPYSIDNMAVGLTDYASPMPVLWWRSVGHSHSGYVMEVLMDMAAEAAGVDPVAFRLRHLDDSDPDQARFAGVLKLAAEKAGWDNKSAAGKGRGVAVHKSFNSYVAQVAEVSVKAGGAISIDKVVCAIDCGVAVNPDVIRAQMESGIGYGLGAVMRNEITLTGGVVDQANFPQYEPLRIADMPHIEVHIAASNEAPSGVGEPGLPPAGPALANAIYAATGKRVTRLPMKSNGVEFA
ncbi:MAG: molybdopterin-dependent oxidoreductase [Gammaproteobacteria bacterium]|nr:molybdopterin-dependent oxidoreductase [Gammaproteobacteria bacterium]